MKKPKLVKNPLSVKLSALNYSLNLAKSKWSFKGERTYGQMAASFGISIGDPLLASRIVTIKDIELFNNQLITIIKQNYESKKYLTEVCRTDEHSKGAEELCKEGECELVSEHEGREEQHHYSRASIYTPRFSDQQAELLVKGCNQVEAAKQLFDRIEIEEMPGQLLLVQTGGGKTYVSASVIKNFIVHKLAERHKSMAPWKIFYVTRSTIVEQTSNVLKVEFNIDTVNGVRVVNIEFLRTQFGSLLVKEHVKIVNGEEAYEYIWNKNIHPILIIWDECQSLARAELSKQARIAEAFNDITKQTGHKVFQVFMSATPFARVCEAKCFAVSTGLEFELGAGKVKLTNENWQSFAKLVAAPAEPYEYCEAAIERLMDKLEPYTTRIKNIRAAHKSYISTQKIHFLTEKEAEEYYNAEADYQKEKAKLEGDDSIANKGIHFLALFTILRKKAEKIKAPHLTRFAIESWNKGKAPAIACGFKGTIVAIVTELITKHGWTRDDISIIWGGATESLTKKKKLTKKIKENELLLKVMEENDIDLEELGIKLSDYEEKTVEQISFEKTHRLHTQKPEDREEERLRYQRQDSKLLLYTFKAGGVGLSAHHEKHYPKARPREGIFTPVYSEKELIQSTGRLPRITSISDTYQLMCYYGGTIEEEVAARVIMKLKCARKVSRGGESWESIITKQKVIESPIIDAIDDVEQSEGLLGDYVEEGTKI